MGIETILLIVCVTLLAAMVWRQFSSTSERGVDQLASDLEKLQRGLLDEQHRSKMEMQDQLGRINEQLMKGLGSTSQNTAAVQRNMQDAMQTQHAQTAKLIEEITGKLTDLQNTNKQVLDFSSQLQNIQNILRNPKQRGVLGEYWLDRLLGNVLPEDAYKMQYHIGDDEDTNAKLIADAVVFVKELIIPIDAKFTLENYNRYVEEQDPAAREEFFKAFKKDVKIRIDETSKYVRPDKKTTRFAFMFIPAEGVYYALMNAEIGSGVQSADLLDYAFAKKVIIVSPTSFYAYLQTVLFGLNQLQIAEQAETIKKRIEELQKHWRGYKTWHDKVATYLRNLVSAYNKSSSELKKMDQDMQRITHGKASDVLQVEQVAMTAAEDEEGSDDLVAA